MFITVCAEKGITRYERGRERSCLSIGGDLRRFVVGASGLELRPSGQERPRNGEDLEMMKDGSGMKRS